MSNRKEQMSSSRRLEIEKAAEEHYHCPVAFVEGAEWADANLDTDYLSSRIVELQAELAQSKLSADQQASHAYNLENLLIIAIEAMEKSIALAGKFSSEKPLLEALAKIRGDK